MQQHRDYAKDMADLGLEVVGTYENGQFVLDPKVRPLSAFYVWMRKQNGILIPIRVGETSRLGSRFSSYNGWLRGRRWPGERRNARENEKARLTKLRLNGSALVAAAAVPSKEYGLAVERILLELWRPTLDLNFELSSSWGRARMREWSATYDQQANLN